MPWTSAVRASTSIEITPPSPETSSPGASVPERGRKRLEVFFASRTVCPVGMASYDARRRSTASSWADRPVTTDRNLLPSGPERRRGPVPRSSGRCRERLQVVVAEPEGGGRDVLLEVGRVAGSGDGEHVRAEGEGPRDADLGRGGAVGCRDGADHVVRLLGGTLTGLAGDGEERDEGDVVLEARGEHVAGVGALVAGGVPVLDAGDVHDPPGRVER